LQPLAAHAQKIMVVSGLSHSLSPQAGSDHSGGVALWLTGAWPYGGPHDSVDQVLANAFGMTPGSTMALSTWPNDYAESGDSEKDGHGGRISFNSKLAGGYVVPLVTSAKKMFDQLFSTCKAGAPNPQDTAANKSILDYVQSSVRSLQKNLGKDDSARVGAYLQNIRDLEVRLTTPTACPSAPTADPPPSGGALDYLTNVRLMADVFSLALGSGAAPIGTLMADMEGGQPTKYPDCANYVTNFVGIGGNKVTLRSGTDPHLDVIHTPDYNSVAKIEQYIAYSQFNMSFFKRILDNLASMPAEPNGLSPLDNCILLAGTAHSDGWTHSTQNIPMIVAGGKFCKAHQGQHVAFPQLAYTADFYYTLLRALGAQVSSFNGHSTTLPGLFG
jgi:hypothetical protein